MADFKFFREFKLWAILFSVENLLQFNDLLGIKSKKTPLCFDNFRKKKSIFCIPTADQDIHDVHILLKCMFIQG